MAEVSRRRVRATRTLWISALCAAVGTALWVAAVILHARHAMFAYLTAWSYVAFVAVGALVFDAAGHASNARWIAVVRRLNHQVTSVLPLVAVLAIPVAIGADKLYPWADPPPSMTEHELHQLHHKSAYLNTTGMVVRLVLYLAIWLVGAELLRRWSLGREVDARAAARSPQRERTFSCVLLPFIGLSVTFAAFDWLMSLQPLWLSTIFGLYVFAGGFVSALALITLLAFAHRQAGPLRDELSLDHFHALGRLLLAFTCFWAYCGYFQAMLIRAADLPHEVTFFLRRLEHGWQWVTALLIAGHFALPFAVLLIRSWKRVPGLMAAVSLWIALMGLIDVYWLVMPAMTGHDAMPDWIDLSAALAVIGWSVTWAAWRQRGVSALAEGDPLLAEGLTYRSRS